MTVEIGADAPDFALQDSATESTFSLSEVLANGPAIVGIYKSSCQASKTMFPMLERFHAAYGSQGLAVLGVSQDSPNVTRSFTRRTGVTFPMLLEGDEFPVSHSYQIEATPTVFLIDREGNVAWQGMGFQKPAIEELNARIAELLGIETVDILADAEDVPGWVPG